MFLVLLFKLFIMTTKKILIIASIVLNVFVFGRLIVQGIEQAGYGLAMQQVFFSLETQGKFSIAGTDKNGKTKTINATVSSSAPVNTLTPDQLKSTTKNPLKK